MPTSTQVPTGLGFWQEWGSSTGASPYVDSDDAGTSYQARVDTDGSGSKRASYVYPSLPPQARRIISVTVSPKALITKPGWAGVEPIGFVYLSSTVTDGGNRTLSNGYLSYPEVFTSVLNTPAKVNAAECGIVASQPPTGFEFRVTYLPRIVEWAASGGAQLLELVLPLVGALLGAGLGPEHLPALAREITRRSGHALRGDELVRVLHELRMPRRVYA